MCDRRTVGIVTFWMMACALPGSPWMSSCTMATARCTLSGLPVTLTCRGTPSGKSCSGEHVAFVNLTREHCQRVK